MTQRIKAATAEPPEPPELSWQLLGDVALHIPGAGATPLGRRHRTVLAVLLLRANKSTSIDEIADALWGEDLPKTARNSIQRFVADLRQKLGEHANRLTTTSAGYQLEVKPNELDTDRARNLLERGSALLRNAEPEEAFSLLNEGLGEFDGEPLGATQINDLTYDAITPLVELHNNLRASRFEAALTLGRHTEIGDELHAFAHENPSSEQAWALYMLGLYRSGRQRKALEAGEALRRRLADEHGITPSPRILKLVQQILSHADELQLPIVEVSTPKTATAEQSGDTTQLPPQLLRLLQGPLAGRDAQLAQGQQLITQLLGGSAAVSFIAGEPGVGKTRLAAELAAMAVAAGSDVFYGRSDEDVALPLGAWTELLGQIAATDLATIERVVSGPARASLHDILPQVTPGLSEGQEDPIYASPEPRRAALFHAISQLFNELAKRRPVTLVLDDVQWADASTLQLLRHVARHLAQPVWIIVTYRNVELSDDHLLRDVVATLLHEPHVQAIALEGIDPAGVAELVQMLLPSVNEARLPDFAQDLQNETKGNPFFVAEIVRDMVERAPDERTLQLAKTGTARALPDTVRHVIRQRVTRLGDDVATTLRSAAIFGREFRLSELAGVLDVSDEQVLSRLEAGMSASFVVEIGPHAGRFAFVHDLLHQALYTDISMSRRRRLHGRAAQIISAAFPPNNAPVETTERPGQDSRASEIAGHYLAASDGNLAEETIEAVTHAASVAARRHAPDKAAALFARGLEALDQPEFAAGFTEPAEPVRLRLAMLVRRGAELRNAGDPDYRQALLDAGELAHDMGDTEAEVEAALANTRGLQTNVWEVDTARVAQLRRAVAVLGNEESARRANLLASLASEQWADEDREDSQHLRNEALALARRVNHRETLANVLARAARARNAGTTDSEFRTLTQEMRSMVSESHEFDPYLVINVLRTIQNQALRDADPVMLHEMADAIRALTKRTQLPICLRSDILSDVLIAGLRGEAEKYLQLAEQALAVSLEMGDPESLIAYEGHYFLGMNMLGRTSEVLPMVAQVLNDRAEIDTYRAIAALGFAVVGNLEDAHALVDQEHRTGFSPGVDDYTIQTLQLWADSAAFTNHRDACAQIYKLLAPYTGRFSGHVVLVTQPIDLSLGSLCRVLEQYDDAFVHFDRADQICEDFDATWMQGLTDISRAETLLARNNPGDSTLAAALVAKATIAADRNNHASIIHRAERLPL